ncbi:MAG: hypothetical protein HKN16_09815, partial [Saprospiraceae bacterium]|nr:hypothetical protein [Saprospiraceae bacterium]
SSTGCEFTVNASVAEPELLVATGSDNDATCLANDGSIFINVSGGNGGYLFDWTGPSFTSNDEDITDLAPGDYDVLITDALGCIAALSANIGLPPLPALTADPSNALCAGDASGSIQLDLISPNGGGSYAWSDITIGDTDNAQNLLAGNYSVVVTDALNCTAEVMDIIVGEPMPIALSFVEDQASCNEANGGIDLTVQGGTGPYSYDWDIIPDMEDPSNVAAGTYNVTVTDANQCEDEIEAIVTQPVLPTATFIVDNADCFQGSDGSIDLTVMGGTPGYTFAWNGTAQSIEDPVSLAAGSYDVTVFDADNCPFEISGIVIDDGNEITVTEAITPATCGLDNGSITVTGAGGAGGFTYDWVDPTIIDGPTASGLGVGNYQVIVLDALGCALPAAFLVDSPNLPSVESSVTDNPCFGDADGIIELTILDGQAPFDYDWEDNQYDGNQNINNLVSGTYNVTVIDDNDCPVELSMIVNEPAQLMVSSLSPSAVSCAGMANGGATVDAMGGTPGYSFEWSNGDMDEDLSSVPGGTYSVIVTDANQCTADTQVTIEEPTPVEVASDFTELLDCNGDTDGEISLVASGGNGGFTYDWDEDPLDAQTNPTNLGPGTYVVIVADALGCSEELSFTIGEPDAMDIQISDVSDFDGFNISCAEELDGFVDLSVVGGSGSYTYEWSTGANTSSISNLAAGQYLVTVTDGSDCVATWETTLDAPSAIELEYEAIDSRCNGESNGAIIVNGSTGGAGSLLFGLNGDPLGDAIFNGLSAGVYNLIAEDANGCQSEEYQISIDDPDPLVVDLGDDIEIAYGDSVAIYPDLSLGGASVELIEWSSNGLYNCLDGDCLNVRVRPTQTTTYTVLVQDENGCLTEDQIMVRVRKERNVYLPNAFNPTGTGNPAFEIGIGAGVEWVEKFIIVDRWGEVVYEKNDFDPNTDYFGWDGRLDGEALNPGVFVYYISIRFIDGETVPYKGDVTLLR